MMKKINLQHFSWATILLYLILAAGLGLRFIGLTNPPFDFHPSRQLQSAAIARGMYYQMLPHADPLKVQAAVNIMNRQDQYEPRILDRIVAVTYLLTGGENLWVARIYTSFFWMIGGLALYGLARRISSPAGGLLALVFYLFLPFSVFASRSFQPDPFMVMWIILALYGIYRWSEQRNWKWAVLTGFFAGFAILIKVFAAVFLGPAMIAVILSSIGSWKVIKNKQVWVMTALTLIIPSIYYFISIPGNSAGFFSFWALSFTNLLFKPRFYFSWLDMIRQIAGESILFISLIGLFILPAKGRYLTLGLWIGYGIFGLLEPVQITTHDYYSLPLVPIIALSLSALFALVIEKISQQRRFWQVGAFGVIFLTILISAWLGRNGIISPDYSPEAKGWTKLGAEMPKDGSIIALTHDYGLRISYYGWVDVSLWPYTADFNVNALTNGNQNSGQLTQDEFDQYFYSMISGHKYFLVTLLTELDAQPMLKDKLYNNYPIYQKGDGYIIFELDHTLTSS